MSTTVSRADDAQELNAVGWRCAVCGADVPIDAALAWRCPHATATDRRHVLRLQRRAAPLRPVSDRNPFVAFDSEFAWAAFAAAHGMDRAARRSLVDALDARIADVAGVGFHVSPLRRAAALSDALGFSPAGGIWVKDETSSVAGSHKARHLFSALLHLRAAESVGAVPWHGDSDRPPLAIASCGNAALAAATLAAACAWPITVFVPPWADTAIVDALHAVGAGIEVCARRAGDPPGDPCVRRFRAAVDDGSIPFSVQGPDNALCLDGGRTIGWEITERLGHAIDRIFVQVGGGALAASIGAACAAAGVHPRLHAVQTEGCAPLARAVTRLGAGDVAEAASRWAELMTPWDHEPRSIADGILDDETYDWLGVVEALTGSGGDVVVAPERLVAQAYELATTATGVRVSATGSAGLAGVIARRSDIDDDERVVVIFSGAAR